MHKCINTKTKKRVQYCDVSAVLQFCNVFSILLEAMKVLAAPPPPLGLFSLSTFLRTFPPLFMNQTPAKVLAAPPPPLGLPRAVASRRRKTDEPDSDSAQQARARDRRRPQVLTSSQKTRQAPPLLHLYSPRRAQEVSELLISFSI